MAGYLVMLRSGLATEPVALAAIGCAATFLAAPATLTRYKYAAYLMLIAFHSLVLCQYMCAPHPPFNCTPKPPSDAWCPGELYLNPCWRTLMQAVIKSASYWITCSPGALVCSCFPRGDLANVILQLQCRKRQGVIRCIKELAFEG